MSDIFDGWLPVDDYCEKYAERRNTVLARMNSGMWERGFHIANPDGGLTYVHEERAKAWLKEHNKLDRARPPAGH